MIIPQEFERFEQSFNEMMRRQEMQIKFLKEQNELLKRKYELEIDNNNQLKEIAETLDYLYAIVGEYTCKKIKKMEKNRKRGITIWHLKWEKQLKK